MRIRTSLIECFEELITTHPEIDLYALKRDDRPLYEVCQFLPEEDGLIFGQSLLLSYIQRYYPLNDDLKHKIAEEDIPTLLRTIWVCDQREKRRVIEKFIQLQSPTLGEALRCSGFTEHEFLFSTVIISDYSLRSMANAMIIHAKTHLERIAAKKMLLLALKEDLAFELIFIPVDCLIDDLFLVQQPHSMLNEYPVTIIAEGREITLKIPDCYQLAERAVSKIHTYLVADLGLSHVIWSWLKQPTLPHYDLHVSELKFQESKFLCQNQHFIDIFLINLPSLLVDDLTELLIAKYLSTSCDGQRDVASYCRRCDNRQRVSCLLGENLSLGGIFNTSKICEQLKILTGK